MVLMYDAKIVKQLSKIYEYKGKQMIYLQYNSRALERLKFAGLYHNVKYICALSGIVISETKLKQILQFRKTFDNEKEAFICGVRDAMLLITDDYEYIDINYQSISNLYLEMTLGDTDTLTQMNEEKIQTLKLLCTEYNDEIDTHNTIDLITIFKFINAFVQLSAFGNKTMLFSRVLLNLLLYKSNILVTQYQSLDQLIFKDLAQGRPILRKKQIDVYPFESIDTFYTYYFSKLIESYENLDENFKLMLDDKITPKYRVLNVLNRSFEPLSRSALERMLADISRKTIERALVQLQKEQYIEKVGSGKATKYHVI